MGERKVLNKYIPADFDPKLVPRGKKPKDDLVPVRMMPPVKTLTGLAGWGATAGFGLFWMIGDESFAWAKGVVVGVPEEE